MDPCWWYVKFALCLGGQLISQLGFTVGPSVDFRQDLVTWPFKLRSLFPIPDLAIVCNQPSPSSAKAEADDAFELLNGNVRYITFCWWEHTSMFIIGSQTSKIKSTDTSNISHMIIFLATSCLMQILCFSFFRACFYFTLTSLMHLSSFVSRTWS